MPMLSNTPIEHGFVTIMRRRRTTPACILLALASVLATGPGMASGEIWHYTLGEIRVNQQGNFCEGADDVTELAGIFRKYGVLPGFSALSHSPNCETRVSSFTPHEIIEEVVIERGKPNEYVIRFLRVEIYGGGLSYLVTTRNVMPAKN